MLRLRRTPENQRSTVSAVVRRCYREQGEEGLRTAYHPERCRKSNGALTALQTKIVEVKQANPGFGVKRISQLLRRIFFVPTSAETVRRTLHKTQLMPACGQAGGAGTVMLVTNLVRWLRNRR